ncbi:anaphase-promoting complex, cyclosome, subunit 3 [Leptospira ryugenii]|uniref:Anaphase-promoting complex, cyclosome, subunit 3 n=1 Tax=Leptospira ryugenii TaxID=1917863 RepID=A0A2P2E3X0_9LEPT|nr:tetratricopeptide repeat protein [Leptospira ryugenii]GBF51536.1 anaphase-promoting complex, cyclosome, subunit 3 [Leptospira ryugenii]
MQAPEIQSLFNEAVRLEKAGERKKSKETYLKIIELSPDHHLSYQNLGAIFSKEGDHRNALDFFLKAIRLNPDFKNYYNAGVSVFKLKEYEKAVHFIKQALHLNKQFILGHLLLAQIYQHLNQDEKTEIYLKNIIKLDPNHKSALGGLAMFYYERKRYPESLKMLERYLLLYPGNAQLKLIQSEVLAKQGNFKESANLLMEMTKTDVGFTHFNETLASAWQEEDELAKESIHRIQTTAKKRLKEFQTKLELSRENPEEFAPPEPQEALDLSLLYLFNGNPEKAMQYLVFAQKMKENTDAKD